MRAVGKWHRRVFDSPETLERIERTSFRCPTPGLDPRAGNSATTNGPPNGTAGKRSPPTMGGYPQPQRHSRTGDNLCGPRLRTNGGRPIRRVAELDVSDTADSTRGRALAVRGTSAANDFPSGVRSCQG